MEILFEANARYDNVGCRPTQTDFDPARVTGSLPNGTPNLLASVRGGTVAPGAPSGLAPSRITGPPASGAPNLLASSRTGSLPATTAQRFQHDAAGRLIQEDRITARTSGPYG